MPRKRKEKQTSPEMCPTKEDRPPPWSQGQDAALKKEKDKITFTEHLSIQSTSYCTGWHMPSHFPGHTLEWSFSAHPEISSTLLPFPLSSRPLAHLLSLHFSPCPLPTTKFSERLWAALAGCQLLPVLHCVAQASSPKQDKQGLFSLVPLLLWHVFLHNNKQWIWLRMYSRKTQNRELQSQLSLLVTLGRWFTP